MHLNFSVIIVSDGNKKYLEESVNSLINQSLEFEKNIQVIVVNRMSDKDCYELLSDFILKYPNNFVRLIVSDDMRMGACRNLALKNADGTFINFMDEKDRWSISAFKKALYHFEHTKPLINMLVCKVNYFCAKKGSSENEELFQKNGAISLSDKRDISQNLIGNVFFRKVFIKTREFDNELNYGDGLLFLSKIILEQSEYPISCKITYNVRIEKINKFATKFDTKDTSYYLVTPIKVYKNLFESISGKKNSEKNRYLQRLIMHEMATRIQDNTVDLVLDGDQKNHYIRLLKDVFQNIEDKYIYECNDIFVEYKLAAFNIKYDDFFSCTTYEGHGKIYYNDICVYDLNKPDIIRVETIDIEGNLLKIDGRMGIPFPDGSYELYFEDQNGKRYDDFDRRYEENVYSLGKSCFRRDSFYLRVPIEKDMVITPYIRYAGIRFSLKIAPRKWSKIEGKFKNSYYMKNGIVVKKDIKCFIITKTTERTQFENAFLDEITERGASKDVIKLRKKVLTARERLKKRVWLFADTMEDGNDNSEFLAKWVSENKDSEVEVVFLLNKDSEAKERVKKFAKVVYFGTELHKYYYLICEFFICSRTDPYIYKFFENDSKYFKDLYPQLIYLQHGVLEKDFTRAVNKFANNFRIFITSAKPEYENMLKLPYGWDETEIKLTGLARHDEIYNMTEAATITSECKEVIIAPTWRKNLAIRNKNTWVYYPEFKSSEFWRFYNSLINDERLLEIMRDNGYIGKLRLHTVIKANAQDFELNDVFKLDDRKRLFGEQFTRGKRLLVTDYSSIATDYAYAKTPVIYAQFDKEDFFNIQSYDEGDFDYEKDGFGTVCYDYEATVQAIIDEINKGCVMSDEILKRRDSFFLYYDNHNSERIFREIIGINSSK